MNTVRSRATSPDDAKTLAGLDQRVSDLEVQIEKLTRRDAELVRLAKEVARLRAEVEEFQQI